MFIITTVIANSSLSQVDNRPVAHCPLSLFGTCDRLIALVDWAQIFQKAANLTFPAVFQTITFNL